MTTARGEEDRNRSRDWLWLAAILVGALAVRLATQIALPHIHFSDEIFQVLEQSHGLVFGYRMVPFEFDVGMRSWILPGLLAVPMWLASLVTDDPAWLTLAVNVSLVLLSLLVVVAAFVAGRRLSLTHAIAAGVVAALWFELIFHAGRTLTEIVATVPLVLALALAGKPMLRRSDLVWLGALLGMCVVLRFHLAPGVGVVGLYVLWRDGWRTAIPLMVGALIPVAISGLVDAWTWGFPFASTINNIRINLIEGLAATFGETPLHGYLWITLRQWQAALPLVVLLALVGARRLPVWLLTAGAILATHSLIGHKELRFIFPALACLVVLAGIGTGEIVVWARRELVGSRFRSLALPAALVVWAAVSLQLSHGPSQATRWSDRQAGLLAYHWLYGQEDLCGLSLRGMEWWETGGYAHLHRRVPVYDPDERDAHPEAYNYLLDRPARSEAPQPAYVEVACFTDRVDEVCVYRRPGDCHPIEGFEPEPDTSGVLS